MPKAGASRVSAATAPPQKGIPSAASLSHDFPHITDEVDSQGEELTDPIKDA